MKVTYQVARWQGATLAVELRGAHPQAEWLIGWLKDALVRIGRHGGGAGVTAGTLFAVAQETWPDRALGVEVERRDRLGSVRIDHIPDEPPSGPRPH